PLDDGRYEAWLALALVGICADAQGVLQTAVRLAVDYAKHREAFGAVIGSFQALQHILADNAVAAESIESTNSYAAWSIDHRCPREALLAARTAKAYLGQVGLTVVQDLMQVLGGIGQTWEHIAHVYTRRLLLDLHLLGRRDDHLAEIYRLRSASPSEE